MELPPLLPAQHRPCKICGADAPLYGAVDFNKSCEEARGRKLPSSGTLIAYNRCPRCGFVFTAAFDSWKDQDFVRAIYNEGYSSVDPDFREARPAVNAEHLDRMFSAAKSSLSVLDYGGGNGLLASLLIARGFRSAETYDPFTPKYAELPDRRFDLVCCFEVLEHVPDPISTIARICALVRPGGMVLFSTLVQPGNFEQCGLFWWYVAPRNGHVSIFSRQSLALAWQRHGYGIGSFNDNLHVAVREIPAFAQHLVSKPKNAGA